MRPTGALAAPALAAAAWACAAPAALGHGEVVSTAPRDGARLAAAPDAVVVTYAAPLAAAVEATVRAPGGAELAVKPRLDSRDARRVVIPVRGGGPGRVAAAWTVLGTDGHELAGSVSFVVRAPAIVAELRQLAALVRRAAVALEAAREAAAAQR